MRALLVAALLVTGQASFAAQQKCTQWVWSGDVYNRKAICVKWDQDDCSNRLHVQLCKSGR